MAKNEKSVLAEAQRAFADNAHSLVFFRKVSQAEVGRAVNKMGKDVAQKTINNIFEARHPSELRNFASIAEFFGVPLWVMFIPQLDKTLLQQPGLDRLVKLMNDYLDCDDESRRKIENVADAYAPLKNVK